MWRGQVQHTDTTTGIAKDLKNSAQGQAIQAQKLRTTLQHASLNDLVVGVAAWNWWVRRQSATLALPPRHAVLSAAMLPVFMYSAYLGGESSRILTFVMYSTVPLQGPSCMSMVWVFSVRVTPKRSRRRVSRKCRWYFMAKSYMYLYMSACNLRRSPIRNDSSRHRHVGQKHLGRDPCPD
jgi:hypothetical protein